MTRQFGCMTAIVLALLARVPAAAQVTSGSGNTEVVIRGQVRKKPEAAPPPLDLYAKPAKYEHVALSPDGDVFAFVTTVDNVHILATYRFSDKTKRAVKLTSGNISAIAFADNDHVLVTSSRTGPRGTCGSTGDGGGGANRTLMSTLVGKPPEGMGRSNLLAMSDPAGATEANIAAALLDDLKIPDCVYYGVRSQDSVTSVDMNAQTGVNLGEHISENANLPLGTPQMTTSDGQNRLIGPYLELRSQTVNRQPTERVYLWATDPATGLGRMIDDHGGDLDRESRYVDDWVVTPDGTPVARATYGLASTVFSIEMKRDGKWKPVLTRKIVAKDHTFAPILAGLAADGASIIVIDAAPGTRTYHYYQLSADGALSAPLEPGDAGSSRAVFDPVTLRLQGFMTPGVNDAYALSDPGLQSLYQQALDAVPGENTHVAAVARDPHAMVVYAQGAEDPGAYYRVDFSTGQNEAIGEDYADIPSEWVAYQSWVDYKAADGLDISALITLPPGSDGKNLPLVVLPHDGPLGHDSEGFSWLAQALASRGYLVMQPNYRGSDGAGAALRDAGNGQWGGKMQSDLDDGVHALVAQGLADPGRVCMVGIGYGGYAALAAAGKTGTYRCAVSINGISDLNAYADWQKSHQALPQQDAMTSLIPDAQWPRAFRTNPASPSLLDGYLGGGDRQALSPASHAADIAMPILLIHDTGDSSVPAQQSRTMRDAMLGAHKAVDLIEVPGDDHAITGQEARLATLTAVTDFLKAHNPAN